jgi:hypothetical protein
MLGLPHHDDTALLANPAAHGNVHQAAKTALLVLLTPLAFSCEWGSFCATFPLAQKIFYVKKIPTLDHPGAPAVRQHSYSAA